MLGDFLLRQQSDREPCENRLNILLNVLRDIMLTEKKSQSEPILFSVNTHFFPGLVQSFKGHNTINSRIKGIVFPNPNIYSGMNLRAFLPNDDVPGPDALAAKPLNPKSLAGTVPAIS